MEFEGEKQKFRTIVHQAQLCVIGGGIAGICSAVSAARRGVKVVLMHERPVLGGNASSEIRMWIRGAAGEDMRETGIIEELALENCYRNPEMNYSIWDSVLFGIVKEEKNITLLMNCSCMDAKVEEDTVKYIVGWQLTTQEFHKVEAEIFADCSGDSILAPLTGARYRVGRESSREFSEDIAPEKADLHTMGMSCLIQARQTSAEVDFKAPRWANHYTKEDFPFRINFSTPQKWLDDNFWWMEIGGMGDSIHDTEKNRDELIKIAYGVWDFIKNSKEVDAKNWTLEWMGFLPGKRESRRYVGDYILTQNDIRNEGRFEDIIAYGGWSMDDHHPKGMQTKERPTIWHKAPSPYGIPYRCLYSCNIDNLMFAGRNISATHTANASARVMATCGQLGQALGNAAAIAIREKKRPKDLYPDFISRLQQNIMEDGCYLPWNTKKKNIIMEETSIISDEKIDTQVLFDGIERKVNGLDHAFEGNKGCTLLMDLPKEVYVDAIRLVFDSDLNRNTWENQNWDIKLYPMRCHVFMQQEAITVPKTLVKRYQIFVERENHEWDRICDEQENYQRLCLIPVHEKIRRIKCVFTETWGYEKVRIYALEVLGG